MIKLADSDDTRPSAPYLDLLAARRAQRATDYLAAYERKRHELENFVVERSLADVVLSARFFSRGQGRKVGWRNGENGASQ